MKKFIFLFAFVSTWIHSFGQTPNNCNGAVQACTMPTFNITPNDPNTNIIDFTSGSYSNPSQNPNPVPGNAGCLLSGETSSTFLIINVVSSGTLGWSIIGQNGGCFDWIMWPYQDANTTCNAISGNTLAPVACNWNAPCNGNTGMAPSGQLPLGGNQGNYETPLSVTAGQKYLLCLSNYSSTNQNVIFNFELGSAIVSCEVSAPDQTICLGNSANVTITTPGYSNPVFTWLVTTGVSNTSGGVNVQVAPTVTTSYQVKVEQFATPTSQYICDTAEFTITVANPPAPNAGPDQSVCLGQPIQLSGTEGVASNSSLWSVVVPPGLTPPATATFSPSFNALNPIATVNQPGVYKFIFREQSPVCGTLRDTVLITVSDLPQTLSKTDPTCSTNSDGTITAITPTATEYRINNGSWQSSNVFTGLAAGTYTVCSRNASGCEKCGNITLVNPAPVTLALSNDTLICYNGTATLTATGGNGTSFTFDWDHSSETSSQVQVSPLIDTYYDVVAINEFGCISEPDSIFVTVRSQLTGTITPDFSICPGYPQAVSASATGGIGAPYTFTWSTTEVGQGSSHQIIPNPATTQVITVLIEDGCETPAITLNMTVTVSPLPQPQFTVDQQVKCEPAVFTLTNTTNPSMVESAYWILSDGQQFSNTQSILTDTLMEGTYNVQLIVTSPDGCVDSVTYTNYLVSEGLPIADFGWTPNPIQMFNTQANFVNQSENAFSSYWTFEAALPGISLDENPTVQFPDGEVGNYLVTLAIETQSGCKDTVSKLVPVLPEVLIYVPNTFTPDGDEYNQSFGAVMAGIDVYDFELNIYNRWGEKVFQSYDISVPWDGTYQGQIVPAGVYTWTIRAKNAINDASYEYNGYLNVMR